MSKKSIIKGTIILTAAGFLTRIIGFFYRIILSNQLGAEKMGVYQLIFPVYGICFTLFASGIQTSISRYVAAQVGKNGLGDCSNIKRILRIGFFYSIAMATTLSILVFFNADFIAARLLAEPSCADSLRILSVAFPFCGITSCINGYYYGLKETAVPATTQLIEQTARVVFVLSFAAIFGNGDTKITCETAVVGLVVGEIASNIFNVLSMYVRKQVDKTHCIDAPRERHIFKELMKLTIPLTSNRLIINVLNSVESVLIPVMLRSAGYSASEALSIFGIFTGMAMPFIMFPSCVTNSFAVLLLPTISEAQAINNDRLIGRTTGLAIKYCLLIGILSTGVFIVFGDALGLTIYNNKMAGDFLVILAWLCPFMYLTTTLSSIINGLGKAYVTFINSIVGLTIRILFVVFAVPKYGITGYLIGALISQLIITSLDLIAVYRSVKFEPNLTDLVLKPGIIIALLGFITYEIYDRLLIYAPINAKIILLGCAAAFCGIYMLILRMTKLFDMKELKEP